MSKVELKIRGSQLGMAGFEQHLKQLKRSQLMRISEFIDMFRTAEKFHHDMKLSYLTCRNKSYLVQQAEDGQFYHILLTMMQEIANNRGLKQRDEVKKLYRWFKANRGVLHSSPHFKGSSQDLYKQPRLKFSDDALSFYSVPSEKRSKSPKKVNFSDEKISRPSATKGGSRTESKCIRKAFEGLAVNRPLTAPSNLHRPKVENNIASPAKVIPPASDCPSLTAHYLVHSVSPHHPEHQAYDRPATAIGLIRCNNSPVEDLTGNSSCSSLDLNQNTEKTNPSTNNEIAQESNSTHTSKYTDSAIEEETIVQKGVNQEEHLKFPMPHLVNPVAQHNFAEEMYDDGLAPNKVVSIHVDIPDIGLVQSSIKPDQPRPIDKWKEYQEAQVYGQDIIGSHQLFGRSGSPGGIRYTVHDRGERPELYTHQVISSYAMENGSPQVEPGTRDALHYQSLEDFYKSMAEYKPGKKRSKSHLRSKSAEQTRGCISDEIADEIPKSFRSPLANSKSSRVHFESIVELSEKVGDKMMNGKEKLSPDPRAGFRKPSVNIKQARPNTAPPESERIKLFDGSPIPPPNSCRPASLSTQSSIDYTPRNRKGEPIILLPEKSEYTVHMRPDERSHTPVLPHAIRHGKTTPETHHQYKSGCGAFKMSPRSAGGSHSIRRPKTAEESMKKRWNTAKASDHNQRVPQAASHVTTVIQPQAVASMVLVNHLGSENRRLRSRMGNINGMSLDEEIPNIAGNMEFVPIISPAPFQVRGQSENRDNQDADEMGNTNNTTDNDDDDNSMFGHREDLNSSRMSTAPSLTSEIDHILEHDETNEVDENNGNCPSGMLEEDISTTGNGIVDESENSYYNTEDVTVDIPCGSQSDITETTTDSKDKNTANFNESQKEDGEMPLIATGELNEVREREDENKYWSTVEDEAEDLLVASRYWRSSHRPSSATPQLSAASRYWRSSHRPSSATPQLSTKIVEPPNRPSTTCGRQREVKLQTGMNKDQQRIYGSESFMPSVYIGLTDEHRAVLMTHPKSTLEFGLMMPQVQKITLSPRRSPRASPVGNHHPSSHGPVSSPRSSPRPSHISSPRSSPRPSHMSSPRPDQEYGPHLSPMPSQGSSPLRQASPSPSQEPFIGVSSSHGSGRMNSLMSEPHPETTSSTQPINVTLSNQDPPSSPDLPSDPPSSQEQDSQSHSYSDTPPQILIKRPSSAPLINNSRPDGMSQFRPVSPAQQSGRRSRSPHLGVSSPVTVRPSSAKAQPKGKEWNGRPLPMYGEAMVTDDAAIQKSKQAKDTVNIRDLFSNKASKQYLKGKERHERLKWQKMQQENDENFRIYQEELWRRDMALMNRGDITYRNWERGYMADKAQRERMRLEKMNSLLHKQALENRKASEYLKRIGPHVDVWELFHGEKRGISKAQMKRAAITLQKYIRGMILRRKMDAVRLKSRVHAATFKKFLELYYAMMMRIARRYLVKKPRIHFDLWQLDDFMERKRHYEYVFAKRAHPGDLLEVKDLEIYFKECDHYPSITEIHDAIRHITKQDPEKPGLKLKEAQVVEISFQIYVPPGCGLTTDKTRKSTWLNPLVNGVEAKSLMGSHEVEKAQLRKSMALVFGTFRERKEKEEQEVKQAAINNK